MGGVGIAGANLTIVNSGTISGGLSGDTLTRANAITFTGGVNILELQAGASFVGNVVAASTADTLRAGRLDECELRTLFDDRRHRSVPRLRRHFEQVRQPAPRTLTR